MSLLVHDGDDDGGTVARRRRKRRRMVAVLAVVAGLALPLSIRSPFWLSVLDYGGIFAIGAIGLDLLTGYTGQVSLGHAFFAGAGAYTAVLVGDHLGLPLPVWLLAAAAVAGVLGALVGPAALRLRGNYLAVVSLGVVFLGLHVFKSWPALTGGNSGTAMKAPLALGPVDFAGLRVGSTRYDRNQSMFLLVWATAALCGLVARNIVRTRPGRAMQAVRDRDLAAEVVGVSQLRTKVGAFVVSSAMAGVAGALYVSYQQYVNTDFWDVFLSIQFLAMMVVGGIGTVYGPVLGAVFVQLVPQVVDRFSRRIPFVATSVSSTHGFRLSVAQFDQMLYGALIVLFLVLEPRGLAALWSRATGRLRWRAREGESRAR